MKLGSMGGGRDGRLVVVDAELDRAVPAWDIVPSLREALERWDECVEALGERAEALAAGHAQGTFAFREQDALAAMPRTFQFLDGSAYLAHVERVRRARGAEMPPSFKTDPLMYQAVSDGFLAPHEPVRVADETWGIDFEAEIGVIVGDVPMGADVATCAAAIRLVVLINDISLRNLIPAELKKGFGFLNSKPRSALSPVALTPDELGGAWHGGKLHRPLLSSINGREFGHPEAGEDMQFSFPELVAHAAKTRPLAAATLIGSGTVANQDAGRGASCLAERRMLEIIEGGEARTPFLAFGDRIRIEMRDPSGASYFGAIDQTMEPYRA